MQYALCVRGKHTCFSDANAPLCVGQSSFANVRSRKLLVNMLETQLVEEKLFWIERTLDSCLYFSSN